MIVTLTASARVVPLTALLLSARVSESAYDKQTAELQQARAQAAAEQSQIAKMLQNLQNAKAVVYGFTDNLPVGAPLQRAGIANNVDLSSRRADNVVAYLTSQGVNPNIISAKGFGDTHPVASNDTADGRAKNRRIEIVMEGPPDAPSVAPVPKDNSSFPRNRESRAFGLHRPPWTPAFAGVTP